MGTGEPPVLLLIHHFADAQTIIVDNKAKVTEAQLRMFLEISFVKYIKAKIEPGMEYVPKHAHSQLTKPQVLLSGRSGPSLLVNLALR